MTYTQVPIPVSGSTVGAASFGSPVALDLTDLSARLSAVEAGNVQIKARVQRTTSSSTTTTTEIGVLRIDDVAIVGNHRYEAELTSLLVSTVSNDVVRINLRYTTDASTPTVTSTVLGIGQDTVANATFPPTNVTKARYTPVGNEVLSVLASVVRSTGAGNVSLGADPTFVMELIIKDLGVDPGSTGTIL